MRKEKTIREITEFKSWGEIDFVEAPTSKELTFLVNNRLKQGFFLLDITSEKDGFFQNYSAILGKERIIKVKRWKK